jgi:hypothetical protein
MRKLFLALLAAGGIATFTTPAAMAMPTVGDVFSGATDKPTEVRLYCYNRYSGAFLHWGPCARDRWRYGYRPYWHRHYYYRPYWRRHYYYRHYYYRRRYWY